MSDPDGGSVKTDGLTDGSTATYSCNENYVPVGKKIQPRKCKLDKKTKKLEWTGEALVCEGKFVISFILFSGFYIMILKLNKTKIFVFVFK